MLIFAKKYWYSRDPIKRAARLTIFEIFFLGISLLIEPARLTILTKSSTLIANQLPGYEYFCLNWLILHLFRPELLFSFAITSVSKVKRHYISILLKNVKELFHPARLTQPARLTGFPKICYPARLIWTARLIGTWE